MTNNRKQANTQLYQRYQKEIAALPLLCAEQEQHLTRRIDAARSRLQAALAGWPPCIAQLLDDHARANGRDRVIVGMRANPAAGAAPQSIATRIEMIADAHHGLLAALGRFGWQHDQIRCRRRALAVQLCSLHLHHRAIRRMLARLQDDPPVPPGPHSMALRERINSAQQALHREQRQLVQSNLRLVTMIARRYWHSSVPLADLIQEGNIGLLRAVEKFDHRRGFRFSTYAIWWIQRAMVLEITRQRSILSVPTYAMQAALRSQRHASARAQAGTPMPPFEELARLVNMPAADLRAACSAGTPALSLYGDADDDCALINVIHDTRQVDPADALMHADLCRQVHLSLAQLPARQAQVLAMRFGIGMQEPRTLEAIGRQLGLTRERIRQIEQQALLRLRKPASAARLRLLFDAPPTPGRAP